MVRRKKSKKTLMHVRLDESLHAKLERAAASRGASLNTEIVERLERSLQLETEPAPIAQAVVEEVRRLLLGEPPTRTMFSGPGAFAHLPPGRRELAEAFARAGERKGAAESAPQPTTDTKEKTDE